MNPASRPAQLSFTAGPAALLGGWALLLPVRGGLEPGPWWTAAHLVWLAAFLLLGLMTLAMRGLAEPVTGGRRALVESVTGVAMFGLAANLTQVVIDLYAGFAAVDGPAMRALLAQAKDVPGVEPLVYGAGAQVFYVAVLAQAVVLALLHRVTPAGAAVTVAGVALLVVAAFEEGSGSALVAVGMAMMWLGTLLLGRGPSGRPAVTAPAPVAHR
ncbi:hypothetical protein FAF44_09805 [Nonomuraea sp. MG754425]|uniref:hypothetical protein n=1 Tax=Nonomuraea sp. MG754425 TaxID=2570319 RepID=UPI001F45E1B0|nr:hypothetical protein [Nonomuraea sp. MG754425]MCF6468679.1 hypothetical protein [Nonomuraea sp. MG754425]